MTMLDNATQLAGEARDLLIKVRETRSIPFKGELREKAGSGVLEFEGYACVTEEPYEMWDWYGPYAEIVRHGAFTKTLDESADVMFLVNHEGIGLARTKRANVDGTMQLAEDETGLHVLANFDPANPIVQGIRSAMKRKDMDEMSMAFRTMRQLWSPDYTQRDILEVSLDKGDVSIVNYGANPATSGGLRSLTGVDRRAYVDGLMELRQGHVLSAEQMRALQSIHVALPAGDDKRSFSVVFGTSEPEAKADDAPDAEQRADTPAADTPVVDAPRGMPAAVARANAERLRLLTHK